MLTMTPQKTPLYDAHVALGAKMTDFHGWMMPLQYSKVVEEHHAVRNHAGLFDISHMGLILLTNSPENNTVSAEKNTFSDENASIWSLLDTLLPQNMQTLAAGKAVYTQFLAENGGILDDVIVYKFPESLQNAAKNLNHLGFSGEGLIICNASNREKIANWLKEHLNAKHIKSTLNVTFKEINPTYCLLALQGPNMAQVLEKAGLEATHELPKRFGLLPAVISSIPVMLCRTGYTGEDGVEIIVPTGSSAKLWQLLLSNGALPCGLAARDTLRLESAYALYGQDIDESTSPIEAGLGWSVPKNKSTTYIGKSVVEKHRETGGERTFICFEMADGGTSIPRHDHQIFQDGQEVGVVTSGGFGPTLNKAIGMGYVNQFATTSLGALVQIHIRNKIVNATLVKRPFYQR